MADPDNEILRQDLEALVAYRTNHLTGDEKGEAQVFCDRLFRAFGHDGVREAGATLEMRIKRRDQRGTAFADLMWKPRVLIEMKRAGVDLKRHYRQAFDYWIHAVPDRPRYVVLCNFDEFQIYDFDRQLDEPVDTVALRDLPQRYEALSFLRPSGPDPVFGNDLVAVTRLAAAEVAQLFRSICARGVDRAVAQRFTLQCVMAMFGEDIGLIPGKPFTRALQDARRGIDAYDLIGGLFREMNSPGRTPGGRYVGTPYFNGGLFASVEPIDLTDDELELLRDSAVTDWSAVRPEIFGTLFEHSMDHKERHAGGAHFTSQADIARVVGPTIVLPWRQRMEAAGSISELERIRAEMGHFKVLDPACGSGNFLYVAYREMRRLEHDVIELIAERRRSKDIAAQSALTYVSPDHFYGIDVNPFAVEIAKVTLMLATKLAVDELGDAHRDVLPLDNLDSSIVVGDALFMEWPPADVIVGNPPYLGRRKMIEELGASYTQRLSTQYPEGGGVSDFVTYWFPLAHRHLPEGGRAGLVATSTIRETDSRRASLDYVVDNGGVIFDAVSSQPWSGDAVVHVSIVNWSKGADVSPKILWLDEGNRRVEVDVISPALSLDLDVRSAKQLARNRTPKRCFQGQTPGVTSGFTLDRDGRDSLVASDALSARFIFPFLGGDDLLKRQGPARYVIDIPFDDLVVAEAQAPSAMRHLRASVLPIKQKAANKQSLRNDDLLEDNPGAIARRHHEKFLDTWWRLTYRRSDLIDAIEKLDRYIALTIVANQKRASVYTFVDAGIRPSASLQVFAFSDDYSMGILHSRLHRLWFQARCSTLKGDLRYTPNTVFDSFPWPQEPAHSVVVEVAETTAQIFGLRAERLAEGMSLARQYDTLSAPGQSRLRSLHSSLDDAVDRAFGLDSGRDTLGQLLSLNLELASEGVAYRAPGGGGLQGTRVSDYRLTDVRS